MRFFRLVRQYPLALLGVIAVAFVAWIWWDLIPKRDTHLIVYQEAIDPSTIRRKLPLPITDPIAVPDTANGLAKLKPGMTRAEVEKLVGAPDPEHVYPATISAGRVTYHATYEADLGPIPTIRPIRPSRVTPVREPDVAGRTLVTLEFDATKPGHPLLGVYYPDPLF